MSLPVLREVDDAQRARVANDLRTVIDGDVRFGQHDRMLYATDASIYQVEPIGVVIPKHAADVERVVRYAAEHNFPILPRGGGSSLAGQTVNRAIILDFSVHCNGVVEIDAARKTVRIQPGIVLDHLNAHLAPHKLMFGPDVASSAVANVGGMIGNNSAGAHSIVYGRTVEHLLGLDVLLADGTRMMLQQGASERDPRIHEITKRVCAVVKRVEADIDRRFPKTVRRVDGYNLDLMLKQFRGSTPGTYDKVNLAHLVCGSEGTLAVTVEALLNLVTVPARTGLAIIAFADVDAALRSVVSVLETKPSAVELIDDVVINMARENMEYRRYVDLLPQSPAGAAGAVLYVEYFAANESELRQQFDELRNRFTGYTISVHTDAAAMAKAWKLRKAGEPLLHSIPGDRKPITFIEDLAVDPVRLADFVAEFRALVARHGTTAAYYAHASVGCLHIRPLVCPRDPKDLNIMRSIAEHATDLVVRYGGALSGEHGDGRVRSHLLERFYGRELCQAFRDIKAIFDPKNLLNPGNIVAPTPQTMTEHLRVHPQDRNIQAPQVKTYFNYQREHGFGEAVEMCNGAGVCRRTKGGTMCPSYRATLDERHATRGRGNALRLAITGQFNTRGKPSWTDAETMKTLDLCLSCKACKSECPSNVDISKLKAEFLAQGFAEAGHIPFKTKLFGRIRAINRVGSAMHPIVNFVNRLRLVKAIASRALGVHPSRSLPEFDQSLYVWMKRRKVDAQTLDRSRPTVLLFPDCFTVYNEPRIGRAAVLTLEHLGYRVVLPRLPGSGCCGRSLISNGMLAEAQRMCRETAHALASCIEQEMPVAIVGCEPSCVSAIKDDWLDLDMNIPAETLKCIAGMTWLVEEFIDRAWKDHPDQKACVRLTEVVGNESTPIKNTPVLLHGHCHQKALWGLETSAAALRRILGYRIKPLDSGCCGMAGAFGYATDHYELSMRIGEQSLFHTLREQPHAMIAAPGTSCRQQVKDALNRDAKHPIELIADAIVGRAL